MKVLPKLVENTDVDDIFLIADLSGGLGGNKLYGE